MDRHPAQVSLQGHKLPPLDADRGVERDTTSGGTAADGVAHEPKGLSPDVPHQPPLRGKERVFAVRCQQDEEAPVAQILQAGLAPLAPSAPGPLRDGDAVTFDQLPVDDRRVLVRRDATPDVEVVAAPDVADGQLLHESRHRGGDAPVTHVHASTGRYGGVKVGSCIGGATFPKAQTLQHLAVLKTTSNLVVLKTLCSRCAQVSRPAPLSEAVFLQGTLRAFLLDAVIQGRSLGQSSSSAVDALLSEIGPAQMGRLRSFYAANSGPLSDRASQGLLLGVLRQWIFRTHASLLNANDPGAEHLALRHAYDFLWWRGFLEVSTG